MVLLGCYTTQIKDVEGEDREEGEIVVHDEMKTLTSHDGST